MKIETILDSAVEKTKPMLDELEAEIIKSYTLFGAGEMEIEALKKWLRPTMELQVKKILIEKTLEGLK